jgi:hypothetical protein
MTHRQSQFPKTNGAKSAGPEPKLPGAFGFHFAFGRMVPLPNDFFAGFSTIKPARAIG